MAISVFKDQERTIRLSQDKDLFEKYFKPLVGLPQSDNHHGMDAMQHTVAVVRSVENVLTELEKTQDIKFNDEEIMALHIAALFHDTGKAKVKVEIRPNEFDYKGHAEASAVILTKFYDFIESKLTPKLDKALKLAIWLVREHTNFHMAIKSNNLHKWVVDNIRSGDFDAIFIYREMVRTMAVLSASDAASKYAVCGDEYHDAIIRYTAERYAAFSEIDSLNIPVNVLDIKADGDNLDKREAERILYMCWNGEIQNTPEQVKSAIARYRANKKYTVSIDY